MRIVISMLNHYAIAMNMTIRKVQKNDIKMLESLKVAPRDESVLYGTVVVVIGVVVVGFSGAT